MEKDRDVEFTPAAGLGEGAAGGSGSGQSGSAARGGQNQGMSGSGTSGRSAAAGAAAAGPARTGASSLGSDRETPAGALPSPDGDGGVREKAKSAASDLGHRAADRVEEQIESRKHRASEQLGGVAKALRSAGQQMPADNEMATYITKAATQVDHLASFLDNKDLTELVDNASDLARRQPAMFVGGAFALGVLGGRFLRSSRDSLVDEGVRDRWDADRMTGRVRNPEEDAVGRPAAPGYAAPSERGSQSGAGESGFR